MSPGMTNRHLSVLLLNSTHGEPAAFSETGQKRNKILLKVAVSLFTGGSVPHTSDLTRVPHKPASVDLGGGVVTSIILLWQEREKAQCSNGALVECQPMGLEDGESQHSNRNGK